jgi:DNA-binding GntR family transcriptional regulator
MSGFLKLPPTVSLKLQAYEGIKNAIINHDIQPGEALFERTLSDHLGISRTPVRESISLLELEGWVKSVPRVGTFVSGITEKNVEEVIQIRRALEVLVIELIIPNITESQLQKLNEIYGTQTTQHEDVGSFIQTDKDFHIFLAELSGNSRLTQLITTISDQMRWFGVSALHLPNRTEQTLQEHAKIIESIKRKDVETAKKAVLEHIKHTRNAVLSSLAIRKGLI